MIMNTSENNEIDGDITGIFKRLINKLSLFDSNYEIIAVDISDIYESVQKYITIVNSVIERVDSLEELKDTFILIESELDHINWHYKSLKKQLDRILDDNN